MSNIVPQDYDNLSKGENASPSLSSNKNNDDRLAGYVNDMLKNKMEQLIFTNRYQVKNNVYYRLIVKWDSIALEFYNKHKVSRYFYALKEQRYFFNEEPMTTDFSLKFYNSIRHVLSDIEKKKAQIFVREKADA